MRAGLHSVNRQIVADWHPLPQIQELFAKLDGATFFPTIDLKAAYHQIELTSESSHITTLISPERAFRYTRMPFGLASAASVFQKLMFCLFGGIEGVVAFQDDILVYTDTAEEHYLLLDRVLQILNEKGMTICLQKCKIFATEVEY